MKKFNLAKVISLVFICVMLLGALSLSVFATEDETVEVVKHNMYYGDTYQIMYAIKAPDGITVKATDSKGNEINVVPFAERPTDIVAGVECKIYILEKGVAAQAIDEVITLTITYSNKTVVDNYSILQYIYERSQAVEGAELEMLQALLNFAIKADIFLDKVTTSFDTYQYVSVEGATVNGANPTGMYAQGATPFANLDAIEYDATGYELAITVNGETKSLDELKALVVADATINVVVSVNEKAHEHSYTPEVTDPTCTADGYTTYTCECGDSYTDNKVDALGHKDENGDFKCDACSVKVLPEDGETLTIAQAITMGKLFTKDTYTTQKYYLTGTITEVQNTTYGNIVISDGENSILIYGLYSYDGKTRYDALPYKPQVHDELTVYGVIGFYNAPQMKNGWMDDVVAHECEYDEEVTNPTCTAKGYTTYTCDVCGDSYTGNETDALGHKFADGVCSVCGVADTHTHNYTPKVTDPTCTADGYTTYTCEECGDSYTDNKVDALGHLDENEDFKCERCSQKALPAADSVLTLEQAIKLAKLYAHNTYTTDKYYVTATIKDVYNTQYGNMYLTDGTNEFTVYGTYSADGKTGYSSLSVKPVKGDTVTIYGIIGTYSSAAQIKNGWITEHIVHEECEYTEVVTKPTCTKPGYTTYTCICGDSYEDNPVDALGHNYVDGVCDRCGHSEGGTEKTEVTVSKTHVEMTQLAGVSTSSTGGSLHNKVVALDENITVKFSQGKAANAPAYYKESIRLYQNGATLTVNAAEGCTIKTIVITLANNTAGDGPISVTGGTASALVNYVYTITANEGATEIVVTTTGTDKNSRLYVADIEVVYEK